MTVQYDFTNGNNWVQFWNGQEIAQDVPNELNRFYSIGVMKPPTTFDKTIIKVYSANLDAKPTWRLAGRYFIKIFAGSVVSGGIPETVIKVGKFYLDQAEIIFVPPYSPDFSIEFVIPYWHRRMEITMWQYTGPNTNTIERKLDDLLGNPMV